MPRESFVIRIASLGEAGYEVHVQSPAGEATAPCDLSGVSWLLECAAEAIPADPDDWRAKGFDKAMEEMDQGFGAWDPVEIGSALYRAVFSDRIQRLFDRSQGLVQDGVLPIELRFELESPHEARLACLPWEFLHDPEGGSFLAQSEETPITRYLAFDGRVRRFKAPAVLRVLVVACSPSNMTTLEWDKELEILGGWSRANIVVDRLEQPDRKGLRRALRRGYHVLHFLGHGTSDMDSSEGLLGLVDGKGEVDWVPGRDLARWIVNSQALRLVVLNACNTAGNGGPRPFTGVASALVHGGVASAVAMRRTIPGDLALEFARVLYGRLAEGRPLEAALSSARQEMAILEPECDHWATPTLYAHTNEVFYVPSNLREAITRVYSWLGVATTTIAINAWSGSQGGPQIPGLNFYEVNEKAVPVFGIFLVVLLLIPLLLVILRYQSGVKERGLFHRLPIAFQVPIGDSLRLARLYQAILFVALVVIPVLSQIHFQRLFWKGDVWTCEKPPEKKHFERLIFGDELWICERKVTVFPPDLELSTESKSQWGPKKIESKWQPIVFSNVFEHKYYFGEKRTPECRPNLKCVRRGEKICDVTFFPFWQPLLFVVADAFVWTLFIAAVWGIWAREPLFRRLVRLFRSTRRSHHD